MHFVEQLRARSIHQACVITGRNSARCLGILNKLTSLLSNLKITFHVVDNCLPCPTTGYVDKLAKQLVASKAECLIALGGGSVIDAVKAVALMMGNQDKNTLWDLKSSNGSLRNTFMPIITVPTTIGTGSEGNGSFAIYHEVTREKHVFFHLSVRPAIAWLHPDHVSEMPADLLLENLADTTSHLLEQYFSEDDRLIWCDYAIIGMLKDLIQCHGKIESWKESIELREEVQLISFMAMSYLFSQGKKVPWSLHHMADIACIDDRHGYSIRKHIHAWYRAKIVSHPHKMAEVQFIEHFLKVISENAKQE